MATAGPPMPSGKAGYYRVELAKSIWDIPERYADLQPCGTGAYGQVSSAIDRQTGMKVAIKKLSRPFQSEVHAKRTFREVKMLKHMIHENIIGLLDLFTPANSFQEFEDVYLVMHLMGADLNNIVKTQSLSDDHVQFLVYQILRGLMYVHSAGIIHRDLKPQNIAVNEDCELRILDFGLARSQDTSMTGYVATRWYRAPEIMLTWRHYDQTVDIWSVGCIMAELITGQVLFPGGDYIDQLVKIMELTGKPDDIFIERIESEDAKRYISSLHDMVKQDFLRFFNRANPVAVDVLERMLQLDPKNRITAAEALQHPYFKQYHDPTDEPIAPPLDQSFEDDERSILAWKTATFEEILSFQPSPELL